MKPIFIAEIKKKSPFGFRSKRTWGDLCKLAIEYGDWVSVHTDHRWGGSFKSLIKVREKTDKPILAKGIHCLDSEIEKALALGADYGLCVGRIPDRIRMNHPEWIDKIIVEPNAVFTGLTIMNRSVKVCCNQRDIASGRAYSTNMVDFFRPYQDWICQASMIETVADVREKVDAFIVGEHLETFVETL